MLSINNAYKPVKLPNFRALQKINFDSFNKDVPDSIKYSERYYAILELQKELNAKRGNQQFALPIKASQAINPETNEVFILIKKAHFVSGDEMDIVSQKSQLGEEVVEEYLNTAKDCVSISPDIGRPISEQLKVVTKPELKLENIYQS